jgi:glyoxylase-like metal-dependent hydrolase (beta-lactamase superfamily II)
MWTRELAEADAPPRLAEVPTARPEVTAFFHQQTNSISYLVSDPGSGRCAIIDPVLDFDATSDRIGTSAADRICDEVEARGLAVEWILETHVHADHPSAAAYLKGRLAGRVAVGARVSEIQAAFKEILNLGPDFAADGSQFDHLWQDDQVFTIGRLEARVIATPGHTPACVSYHIGDAVFVGDTLLMPDYGTARCDFPGGSAAALYRSIRRLLALPRKTRVFVGHDYPPAGRSSAWESTVGEQNARNVLIHAGVSEADFITAREARDAALARPALFWPAIQMNIRGGRLPPAEDNGTSYFKVPVKTV